MKTAVMEKPALGLKHFRRAGFLRMGPTSLMQISKILMVKDELALSEDQIEKLWDLRAGLAHNLIKLSADIRLTRFDYLQSICSNPVNFTQIRANAEKLSDLRLQRKFATIDAYEKGLQVLDSDQKNKLVNIVSEMIDEGEPEYPEFQFQ